MKAKLVLPLVRAISVFGVSILLFGQIAFALDNWTTNQVSTNYFRLEKVVYGNGRYVAFGEFSDWGMVTTSEDGKDWTLRADGLYGNSPGSGAGLSFSVSLAYTGNRFFALGGFGISAVSTNGLFWDAFGHTTNGVGLMASVAYGSSRYVAVGPANYNTATNVWTSSNGKNWTPRNAGTPINVSLIDVAYGAGTFVAIPGTATDLYGQPDPGHVYTSPTGILWTQRNIPGGSRVSFCNGLFIIPFGGGANLISTNGLDWAAINTGITNVLEKVYYYAPLFMARSGAQLVTSVDGTNWVAYSQILPGVVNEQNFATDGKRLVTVGGTPQPDNYHYTGWTYLSAPTVAIQITNTIPPQLIISGLVGRSYRIEVTDNLADTNAWQTLTTLQLPNSPYLFTDPTATNSPQRFYRGVLLP